MRTAMYKRLAGWGLAAAGTAAALFFVASPDGGKAPAASADRSSAPQAVKKSPDALLDLAHRAALPRQPAGELFAAPVVEKPRAQQPMRVVVEKPVAPNFPYKYAGWLRGGSSPEVYLAHAGRVFPVKVGDVVDGFRVDAIRDERIELTFVALGERTTVALPVGPDGAGNVIRQAAQPASQQADLNVAGAGGDAEAGYRPSRE